VRNFPSLQNTQHLKVTINQLDCSCSLSGRSDHINFAMAFGPIGNEISIPTQTAFWDLGQRFPLPELKSLSFDGISEHSLPTAGLPQILRDFSTITSLSFTKCHSSYIEVLVVTTSPPLCPLLERLELEACDVSAQSLITLVSSRTRTSDPLVVGTVLLCCLILKECTAINASTVQAMNDICASLKVHLDGSGEVK